MSEPFDLSAWLREYANTFAEGVKRTGDEPLTFTVKKLSYIQPISDEMLHPERYPAPKITWRRRMWWRWYDYRQRISTAWSVLRNRHDCGEY